VQTRITLTAQQRLAYAEQDERTKAAAAAAAAAPKPEAFDAVQGMIDDVAARGGTAIEKLGYLADRFVAIEDTAKRADLGRQLFGRGWAEMAPLLALGSKGLGDLAEEWKKLEITATPAEEKMATAYLASFSKLEKVIGGLTNAVGNILGQLFTPGMEAMAKWLSGSQAAIRSYTQSFVDAVRPWGEVFSGIKAAFTDIGKVMSELVLRLARLADLRPEPVEASCGRLRRDPDRRGRELQPLEGLRGDAEGRRLIGDLSRRGGGVLGERDEGGPGGDNGAGERPEAADPALEIHALERRGELLGGVERDAEFRAELIDRTRERGSPRACRRGRLGDLPHRRLAVGAELVELGLDVLDAGQGDRGIDYVIGHCRVISAEFPGLRWL